MIEVRTTRRRRDEDTEGGKKCKLSELPLQPFCQIHDFLEAGAWHGLASELHSGSFTSYDCCPCRTEKSLCRWRALSIRNRRLADLAAKSLVDRVRLVFSCRSRKAAYCKLDFFVLTLKLDVTRLKICQTDMSDFKDSDVEHLVTMCPQLESIELFSCIDLTDAAAMHLAKCAQLQTISLEDCWRLTDAAVDTLVASCPRLREVAVNGCEQLTDLAAMHLARCKHLQTVDLRGCFNLTDVALEHLSQCPQLRYVFLGDSDSESSMTDVGAEHLS